MAWFRLTFGKKAQYSGGLPENAIFCPPTQDSGNQAFPIKGHMRNSESVLLLKALWKLCVLSLQQPHASQLPTLPRLRFESRSDRTPASALSPGEAGGLRFLLSAVCSSFRCASAPPPGRLQNHWHSLWPATTCWWKEWCSAASLLALFAETCLGSTASKARISSNAWNRYKVSDPRLPFREGLRPLGRRGLQIPEDDSRPLLHYLMLQQSFLLFTMEDSRATWNNTLLYKLLCSPDQSLKQLEQMEGDNLCCSHLGLPVRD